MLKKMLFGGGGKEESEEARRYRETAEELNMSSNDVLFEESTSWLTLNGARTEVAQEVLLIRRLTIAMRELTEEADEAQDLLASLIHVGRGVRSRRTLGEADDLTQTTDAAPLPGGRNEHAMSDTT